MRCRCRPDDSLCLEQNPCDVYICLDFRCTMYFPSYTASRDEMGKERRSSPPNVGPSAAAGQQHNHLLNQRIY